MRLALVALAELFTSARRGPAAAPRARAAARAAPVAPLLPRAAVGIGTRVEGFDVLGLEILIRISVVIPVWNQPVRDVQLGRNEFDFHTVTT